MEMTYSVLEVAVKSVDCRAFDSSQHASTWRDCDLTKGSGTAPAVRLNFDSIFLHN